MPPKKSSKKSTRGSVSHEGMSSEIPSSDPHQGRFDERMLNNLFPRLSTADAMIEMEAILADPSVLKTRYTTRAGKALEKKMRILAPKYPEIQQALETEEQGEMAMHDVSSTRPTMAPRQPPPKGNLEMLRERQHKREAETSASVGRSQAIMEAEHEADVRDRIADSERLMAESRQARETRSGARTIADEIASQMRVGGPAREPIEEVIEYTQIRDEIEVLNDPAAEDQRDAIAELEALVEDLLAMLPEGGYEPGDPEQDRLVEEIGRLEGQVGDVGPPPPAQDIPEEVEVDEIIAEARMQENADENLGVNIIGGDNQFDLMEFIAAFLSKKVNDENTGILDARNPNEKFSVQLNYSIMNPTGMVKRSKKTQKSLNAVTLDNMMAITGKWYSENYDTAPVIPLNKIIDAGAYNNVIQLLGLNSRPSAVMINNAIAVDGSQRVLIPSGGYMNALPASIKNPTPDLMSNLPAIIPP